jgi:hypothetical protein
MRLKSSSCTNDTAEQHHPSKKKAGIIIGKGFANEART